jgi:hypothetical protein
VPVGGVPIGCVKDWCRQQFSMRKNIGNKHLRFGGRNHRQRDFDQLMLMRVANHLSNARQGCDLVWGPLRIAAGYDDLTLRIFSMNPANRRPCILVRRSSDRASIQDHDPGIARRRGTRQTALMELAFQRGTVSLCSPASKVLYEKTLHKPNVNRKGAESPSPIPLSRGHLPLLPKAFTAQNRAALGWAEGDGSVFSALRADRAGFHFGKTVTSGGGTNHRDTLRLAGPTVLGFILELFVVEEQLFAGGENEIGIAIDALQHLVLEFH